MCAIETKALCASQRGDIKDCRAIVICRAAPGAGFVASLSAWRSDIAALERVCWREPPFGVYFPIPAAVARRLKEARNRL